MVSISFLSCVSVLTFLIFSCSFFTMSMGDCCLLPYFLAYPPPSSFPLYLWVMYLTCLCGICILITFVLGGDWNGNLLMGRFLWVFYKCLWTCVFTLLTVKSKNWIFSCFSVFNFVCVYLFYCFYQVFVYH